MPIKSAPIATSTPKKKASRKKTLSRSRTNPNFSQIDLSANSSDIFSNTSNRTLQQSFIQERKYRSYADVVKGKALDNSVDHGRTVEGQKFARKNTVKKKLPAGHRSTSQNHVISDKALGDFLVEAIKHMLNDDDSSDLSKELFERKVEALELFLRRIFHKKEVEGLKEAERLLHDALKSGKKSDIDGFVNYVASNASNNAVEGDGSVNSGIGEKMDAPVDLQGRLFPFFERARNYFLDLANELTRVLDDSKSKVVRDKEMQRMVLAAISPDIVAGAIRASALPYVDNAGEGKSFEAPANLSGSHDQRFLTSGKITHLSQKEILKKKLTKAQSEHVGFGFLHHRATTPKPARTYDEELLIKMEKLSLESSSSEVAQQDLDSFNRVSDDSNLTQQNVDFLLRKTLEKMSYDDDEIVAMVRSNFMITAISDDESLDHGLRDAILHFLGQDPAVENFTIFLCSGRIENGEIVGNSHWSALHLNMLADEKTIEVLHANSSGDAIPSAVARVIKNIAALTVEDLVEDGAALSDLHQRALARLEQVEFCEAKAAQCSQQEDGFSCGYHAVFNGVVMHERGIEDSELHTEILQDDEMIEIGEFIENRRQDLKERFNQGDEFVEDSIVSYDDFLKGIEDGVDSSDSVLEASLPSLSTKPSGSRRLYSDVVKGIGKS
jgi:hypothetical protein